MNDASALIEAANPSRLGRLLNRLRSPLNDVALEIFDVTPGAAAIVKERARVISEHEYTPEHDFTWHSPEKLMYWSTVFTTAARRKVLNIGVTAHDFVGVPWDVPLDRPTSYYATIAGQLTAAALDLLIIAEEGN